MGDHNIFDKLEQRNKYFVGMLVYMIYKNNWINTYKKTQSDWVFVIHFIKFKHLVIARIFLFFAF